VQRLRLQPGSSKRQCQTSSNEERSCERSGHGKHSHSELRKSARKWLSGNVSLNAPATPKTYDAQGVGVPNVSTLPVRFAKDQRGATAIEYGLIAALIVLVVVAGMGATGTSVGDMYRTMLGIAVVALAG
jgi:pilus assembly protein Flp/PilA